MSEITFAPDLTHFTYMMNRAYTIADRVIAELHIDGSGLAILSIGAPYVMKLGGGWFTTRDRIAQFAYRELTGGHWAL